MKDAFAFVPFLLLSFVPAAPGQAPAPPPDPAAAGYESEPATAGYEDEIEVLTQGPVHEAYAAPVMFNPSPGAVVPIEPPADIEELPPDEKPEGDDVVWIPGYWSFDDTRNDFIWVSGIWRVIPPGRQWVPGYWTQDGSWQWVNGYWAAAETVETEYYDQPPKTLEAGPNTPAPSPEHQWVPGSWQTAEQRFVWRPGFWMMPRPDWVWTPSSWVWTPAGFTFVDGYWDQTFDTRGVMFAPVFVPSPFRRVGWSFGPSIVLRPPVVFDNFFCRPRFRHFFFGDYYAPECVSFGFFPSFSFHGSAYGYDPIFAHTVVFKARSDGSFVTKIKDRYAYLRGHPADRPPVTYIKQVNKVKNVEKHIDKTVVKDSKNVNIVKDSSLAAPLKEVAAGGAVGGKNRFQQIDASKQKYVRDQANDIVALSKERNRLEGKVRSGRLERAANPQGGQNGQGGATGNAPAPEIVKLPRSPAAGSQNGNGELVRRAPPRPSGDPGRNAAPRNLTGDVGQEPKVGDPTPRGNRNGPARGLNPVGGTGQTGTPTAGGTQPKAGGAGNGTGGGNVGGVGNGRGGVGNGNGGVGNGNGGVGNGNGGVGNGNGNGGASGPKGKGKGGNAGNGGGQPGNPLGKPGKDGRPIRPDDPPQGGGDKPRKDKGDGSKKKGGGGTP